MIKMTSEEKITRGKQLEKLIKTEEYKTLVTMMEDKAVIYTKNVMKGLPEDNYHVSLGIVKGLNLVETMIEKAIYIKKQEVEKNKKKEDEFNSAKQI